MNIRGKRIVISGINLFEGGPLSIYYDFLDSLIECGIPKKNHVTAFVHKKELFKKYIKFFNIIELPKSRDRYLNRLFYEWIWFHSYSKKCHIHYWISLHDITPRVRADHLYTYCHNATPFYKAGRLDWKFNKTIALMSVFYTYLYAINIQKNDAVIVQQEWIRQEFKKRYKVKNVIVAKPTLDNFHEFTTAEKEISPKTGKSLKIKEEHSKEIPYRFIYASFPRPFKNFETIFDACRKLETVGNKCIEGIEGRKNTFEIVVTIDGTENKYSEYLKAQYGDLKSVRWIGWQSREELFAWYKKSDCMIFPSKLETWGLPITEFKETGKPIIVADLPYAHETVGDYERVYFFKLDDTLDLIIKMVEMLNHKYYFSESKKKHIFITDADDWYKLDNLLFAERKEVEI